MRSRAGDSSLGAVFNAIAARDPSKVSRLLAESPALARQAEVIGATRAEASACYFGQSDADGGGRSLATAV